MLLVDDDPLVSFALTEALRDAGYAAIEAANTGEAIEVLRQTDRIRVLVTDVNMPGSVTGLGLVRVAQEGWPYIGIVVISGQPLPQENQLPDDVVFLSKPFSPSTLLELIQKLLE